MKQLRHFGIKIEKDNYGKNLGDPFAEGKIKEGAGYGEQIKIRCKNCGAVGNTKNIGYIGARTIFPGCTCGGDYEVV